MWSKPDARCHFGTIQTTSSCRVCVMSDKWPTCDQRPDSPGGGPAGTALPLSLTFSGCQQGQDVPEREHGRMTGARPCLCLFSLILVILQESVHLVLQSVSQFLQSQNCLEGGAHLKPCQSDVSWGGWPRKQALGWDKSCPPETPDHPWGGCHQRCGHRNRTEML